MDNGIFELPEYISSTGNFCYRTLIALVNAKDPILDQIENDFRDQIHSSRNTIPSGEIVESPPIQLRFEIMLKEEDVIRGSLDALFSALDEAAEKEMPMLMTELFSRFEQLCGATGSRIDAAGQHFNFDLMLDALEKIQIDFDANGKPQLPILVMHPDMARSLPTPTQNDEDRLKALIERKRCEFYARQHHRKLS